MRALAPRVRFAGMTIEGELFEWEGLGNHIRGPEAKVVSHADNRAGVLAAFGRLESENARLAALVAELEARIAADTERYESNLRELGEEYASVYAAREAQVAELQSQLAWTPVSAGLPTEEGAYEFEFRQTSKWRLQITKCGYCWSLLGKPIASHPEEFDEFRRIELPEAV